MTRNETVEVPAPSQIAAHRAGRSHLIFLAVVSLLGIGAIKFALFPDTFSSGPRYSMDSQEVFASHIRSLGVTPHESPGQVEQGLADLHSDDPGAVHAWLAARLAFDVPVAGLSDQGFTLIGGRLDYMHDRPVAAIVYHRGQHLINVFVWPGESDETTLTRDGLQFVHWNSSGLTLWAISDLNTADLQEFVVAFRSGANLR